MPADRSTKPTAAKATRQLTLTGKPAPLVAEPSSSKSKLKSKPDRAYTDAVLVIKPEFVELIASRKKNHEYRTYSLRQGVVRLWLYETAPSCKIAFVVLTGPPKTPGQVCDPSGVGNDDFDQGLKVSKFGFPVLALYKLKTPLVPNVMKEKYGLTPPQGYVYATKKMVDDLPLDDMEKLF